MGFTWEKITLMGQEGIQITGYEGALSDLLLPDVLEELPVRSIAAHAFSGRDELRSVRLGRNLKMLRPFAFYNCTALRTMELCSTTDDCYDGVIRQCPSLRRITVHMIQPDNYVLLRSLLQDVDSTLTFRLLFDEPLTEGGGNELRLTFPEYVNEAREDTMARAIHFSIEGAGMAYRECVGKRQLDLNGYDRLLDRLTEYDFAVAVRIALDRLQYPVGLSEQAEKGYESFLRENAEGVLEILIHEDREDSRAAELQLLTRRRLPDDKALEHGLQLAAQEGRTGLCGILMEYRRTRQGTNGTAGAGLQLEW